MPVPAGGDEEALEPSWRPSLEQVADYVPWRTLTRAESSTTEGEDTYQATFSATTRPPGEAVERLIGNAAARVGARIGLLHDSLQGAARTATCLLTASWIERSWPEDQDAQTRADALEKQGELLLDELASANEAVSGEPEFGLDVVYPTWSFPAADPRWDCPTYF